MEDYTNQGQLFLHEMMHLSLVNGPEPHISDNIVRTDQSPSARAYGGVDVRLHARAPREERGGAMWSSQNADSYAVAATAHYGKALVPCFRGSRY